MYLLIDSPVTNQFNLGSNMTQLVEIDDFEEITGLAPKLCYIISLVTEFLISDVVAVLFLLFDKYGEDPMKRSLYNRINSQGAYPLIFSSLLCTPAWTWRVFIGPRKTFVADVVVFIANSCTIWILLCLTEAIVVRAVLLTKFKYIIGINDNFFSIFMFMFNAGFTFGYQIGLFYLGSLGSDELLTGSMIMVMTILCKIK